MHTLIIYVLNLVLGIVNRIRIHCLMNMDQTWTKVDVPSVIQICKNGYQCHCVMYPILNETCFCVY